MENLRGDTPGEGGRGSTLGTIGVRWLHGKAGTLCIVWEWLVEGWTWGWNMSSVREEIVTRHSHV